MPPDNQSSFRLGYGPLRRCPARAAEALDRFAGDVLGLKSTSEVFVGCTQTVARRKDKLIEQFDFAENCTAFGGWKILGRHLPSAQASLWNRKSQIVSITVNGSEPSKGCCQWDKLMWRKLNRLVSELSTSSGPPGAHLPGRAFAKQSVRTWKRRKKEFSEFASKKHRDRCQGTG